MFGAFSINVTIFKTCSSSTKAKQTKYSNNIPPQCLSCGNSPSVQSNINAHFNEVIMTLGEVHDKVISLSQSEVWSTLAHTLQSNTLSHLRLLLWDVSLCHSRQFGKESFFFPVNTLVVTLILIKEQILREAFSQK